VFRLATVASFDDRADEQMKPWRISGAKGLGGQPVESSLQECHRLVIVPDGTLAYLPFETLIQTTGTPAQHLIERFAIAYAPSATALGAIKTARKKSAAPRGMVLAFGDPVYNPEKPVAAQGVSRNPRSAHETCAFRKVPIPDGNPEPFWSSSLLDTIPLCK
jgi:hypothetical protein